MSLYEDDGKPPVIYYNVLNGFESEEPFTPELCGVNMDLETYNKKVEETRQEEIKRWNELREWGLQNGTTNLEYADENWIYQPPGVIRVDRYNAHLYYSPNTNIHDNFQQGLTREIQEIVTKPEYAAGTVIFSSQDGTTSQVISTTPKTRSRMDHQELELKELMKNPIYAEMFLNKEYIERERREIMNAVNNVDKTPALGSGNIIHKLGTINNNTTITNPTIVGDGIDNLAKRLADNAANGVPTSGIPVNPNFNPNIKTTIHGLTDNTGNTSNNVLSAIKNTNIFENNNTTNSKPIFTSPSTKILEELNKKKINIPGTSVALADGNNNVTRLGSLVKPNTLNLGTSNVNSGTDVNNASNSTQNASNNVSSGLDLSKLNELINGQQKENIAIDQNLINAILTSYAGSKSKEVSTPLIKVDNEATSNSLKINLLTLSNSLVQLYKGMKDSEKYALNAILELAGIDINELVRKENVGLDYNMVSKAVDSIYHLITLFKTCNKPDYVQKAIEWEAMLKAYLPHIASQGKKSFIDPGEFYRFVVNFTYDGLFTLSINDMPELKYFVIEGIKYFEKQPVYKTAPSQLYPTGEINMSSKIFGNNGLIERELSKLNNNVQTTGIKTSLGVVNTNATSNNKLSINSNLKGGNNMNSVFSNWENKNFGVGTANGFGNMKTQIGQGITTALGGNNTGLGVGVNSNIVNNGNTLLLNRNNATSTNTNGLFGGNDLRFNNTNTNNGLDVATLLLSIIGSVQNVGGQSVIPVNALSALVNGGKATGIMDSYGVNQPNNGLGFGTTFGGFSNFNTGTTWGGNTSFGGTNTFGGTSNFNSGITKFTFGTNNNTFGGTNNAIARWNSGNNNSFGNNNFGVNNNNQFGAGFGTNTVNNLTGLNNNNGNSMFGR